MSRVVVTLDTDAKTLTCNIDGQVFDGPKSVNMWHFEFEDGDSFVGMDIEGADEKISDTVTKRVRITADKKGNVEITEFDNALEEGAFKLMGLKKDPRKNRKNRPTY